MNAIVAGSRCPLPNAAQVSDLLGFLFDGLTVKAAPKLDLGAKAGLYFGVYVTDDGMPAALCACDTAFAANTGAALSMLPPNVAKESIKTRELTEVMLANLHEVMNICTRFVIHDNSTHVRLQSVCTAAAPTPAAKQVLAAVKSRMDFEVTIPKYGPGFLSAISA